MNKKLFNGFTGTATALALATVAVSIGVSPAFAGELRGSVKDAKSGLPLVGAQVSVIQTSAKNPEVVASTDAGADGSFQLSGLTEGKYVVTVIASGHRPANQKEVIIGNETPQELSFNLTPR